MSDSQTQRTDLWSLRGGHSREFGISRCKLLYIEQIHNKVLLCRTGSYIQLPMINHHGKEYEKEDIYIYISVCSTAAINTTLYINSTSIKPWSLTSKLLG